MVRIVAPAGIGGASAQYGRRAVEALQRQRAVSRNGKRML
jgi:hypothetical protein